MSGVVGANSRGPSLVLLVTCVAAAFGIAARRCLKVVDEGLAGRVESCPAKLSTVVKPFGFSVGSPCRLGKQPRAENGSSGKRRERRLLFRRSLSLGSTRVAFQPLISSH